MPVTLCFRVPTLLEAARITPHKCAFNKAAEIQIHRLVPSKAAGERDRQTCAIPFALLQLRCRRVPEPLRLFRSQPIPESDADLPDCLDASYASGEVWA